MIDFHGEKISLLELGAMVARSEFAFDMLKKEYSTSYEDFVDSVYESIDKVFAKLEENPQHHFPEDVGEDKITNDIANMLVFAGFDARQGQTQGGNIDLTVKGKKSTWSWIGEAKIFKDINSLREGFLQLSTRYRNASPLKTQAGILAYVKRKNAVGCLAEWQTEISNIGLEEFSTAPCRRRGPLAFYTVHKHEASGLPIKVRHIAISLYHLPKDKSGLTAKKYQKAHAAEGNLKIAAMPKLRKRVATNKQP